MPYQARPPRKEGDPCESCGTPMVTNPHTGKVFCPDKCWLKTPQSTQQQAPQPAPTQPVQQFEKELDQSRQDEKWEKISEGKVRHGVSVAFIRNGASASPDNFTQIEKWVRFIMTGEINVPQEPTT